MNLEDVLGILLKKRLGLMADRDVPCFQGILKTLGPGLIFAGTCIGVSHIVQSTRAGASFGFGLLWAVLAANIFKFPFFEFAPRYVIATGEHLLHGYRRVGKWAFYLFFILSLCTMLPIQSAVTLVTTGLFAYLIHWTLPPVVLSAIILLVCCVILLMGRYPLLDKMMKVLIIFLGISTVIAFVAAVLNGSQAKPEFTQQFVWNAGGVSFLVALMGWMPTTLEIGVWHSFWTSERIKQTNHQPNLREAMFDFHLGYWGTMMMAVFFLSLGALVMFGTGEKFSDSAVQFSGQVISLYTKALGPWSYWVIGIAAATTMFSTTICCLDAFPRVIREALIMINPKFQSYGEVIYTYSILTIATVSCIIIGKFIYSMKTLIDFATIVAFCATPIFAFLNLKAVTGSHVPEKFRPGKILIAFSWICLILLASFSILFIIWRFILS